MNRLDALQALLRADPSSQFARYGLAQELFKAGKHAEAVDEYERIILADSDYQAAYYHAGKALERLGRTDDALAMYERGVEASYRTGNLHARSELQEAIQGLSG